MLKALTGKTLTFEGKFYNFRDVPIELEPVQKPHPPLWYGAGRPDSVVVGREERASTSSATRRPSGRAQITDRYRAEWATAGKPAGAMPLMGMNRHIVIAETEAEALAIARRAYKHLVRQLHASLAPARHGLPTRSIRATFDELEQDGQRHRRHAREGARRCSRAQITEAGNNYLVCRLAFGDLTLAESLRSIDLFARAVMPALSGTEEAAE